MRAELQQEKNTLRVCVCVFGFLLRSNKYLLKTDRLVLAVTFLSLCLLRFCFIYLVRTYDKLSSQ